MHRTKFIQDEGGLMNIVLSWQDGNWPFADNSLSQFVHARKKKAKKKSIQIQI